MLNEIGGPTTRDYDRPSNLSLLDRPARIKVIKDQLGFYPQNNNELYSVIALIGRDSREMPVLSYLDEVYKHQRAAHADAPATLRSIARSFEAYAGNALDERLYMEKLLTTIRTADPNPLTGFTRFFPTENWESDGTMRATLTAVARYVETGQFAEIGEVDSLSKENLIDEATGYDRVSRVIGTLGLLRMSSLERTANAIYASQDKRLTFWIDTLKAARSHFFVRDIADVALHSLHTYSS